MLFIYQFYFKIKIILINITIKQKAYSIVSQILIFRISNDYNNLQFFFLNKIFKFTINIEIVNLNQFIKITILFIKFFFSKRRITISIFNFVDITLDYY